MHVRNAGRSNPPSLIPAVHSWAIDRATRLPLLPRLPYLPIYGTHAHIDHRALISMHAR